MSWLGVIRVRQQDLNQEWMATNVIQQKGMTFDHDFGYLFHLFSSLLKKEGRRKKWIAKIMIKSHSFLLDSNVYLYCGQLKGVHCTKKIWTLLNRVYKFNLYITFISLNWHCLLYIEIVYCKSTLFIVNRHCLL